MREDCLPLMLPRRHLEAVGDEKYCVFVSWLAPEIAFGRPDDGPEDLETEVDHHRDPEAPRHSAAQRTHAPA